jgi:hypothetical protein
MQYKLNFKRKNENKLKAIYLNFRYNYTSCKKGIKKSENKHRPKFNNSMKTIKLLASEFAKHGFGWTVGIITAKMVSAFFTVSSWKNGWGLFTSKSAVSSSSFTIIEFLAEGVLGFLAFVLVNQIVKKFGHSQRTT